MAVSCGNAAVAFQVLQQMGPDLLGFIKSTLKKRRVEVAEVYHDLILPCLMEMSEVDRLEHLAYVRDAVLPRDEHSPNGQRLIETLKSIPFVDCKAGSVLRMAKQVFSPRKQVNVEFVSEDFIVSDKWLTKEWSVFVRKLGLNDHLSRANFLKFAKAVEVRTCYPDKLVELPVKCPSSERVREAAAILLEAAKDILQGLQSMLQRPEELQEMRALNPSENEEREEAHRFLLKLRTICFVFRAVPDKVVAQSLRGMLSVNANQLFQFVDKTEPVAFCGSSPCYFRALLWTQCAILPDLVSEHVPRGLHNFLGLHSPPTLRTVINHTKTFCSQLQNAQHLKKRSEEGADARCFLHKDFVAVYKFLERHLQGSESEKAAASCIGELRNFSSILVDDASLLINPSQVTMATDIGKNLLPYLAPLPAEFIAFRKLMECLGVTRSPSMEQYASVLRAVHLATKGRLITSSAAHANIFVKVKEASQQLLELASKTGDQHDNSATQSSCHSAEKQCMPARNLTPLFLPANSIPATDRRRIDLAFTQCCLLPAEDVIVNDSFRFSRRIKDFLPVQYLVDWQYGLAGNQRDSAAQRSMSGTLGVRLLTQAVEMKEVASLNDPVNCVWRSESSDQPPRMLNIHPSIVQLHALLRSVTFGEGVRRLLHHTAKPLPDFENTIQQLKECTFVVVRIMETVLQFKPTSGGKAVEIPKSAQEEMVYFVRKPRLTLFFRELSDDPEEKKRFFRQVSRKLKILLTKCEFMEDLCECSPDTVHEVLDKLDVEPFGEMSSPQRFSSDPPLGCDVPVDTFNLAEDPTMPFAQGEYVVYQVPGRISSYILARIVRELTTDADIAREGPYSRRFLIEIDMEGSEEEVSVVDLFKLSFDESFSAPTDNQQLVVSSEDSTDPHLRSPNTGDPATLDQARSEIRRQVRDAFQLRSETDRRKVIKRLYLRWHPDKNSETEKELYTEAFKFLKFLVGYWEKHGKEPTPTECEARGHGEPSSNRWWEQFDEELRNTFPTNRGRRRHFNYEDAGQSANPSTTSMYEARRWLRQVDSDISFVRKHVQEASIGGNAQACFLAQQVVEKVLKAGLYSSEQGLKTDLLGSHDIRRLAMEMRTAGCSVIDQASVVADYYLTTRYPNRVPRTTVPCENFNDSEALEALQACEEVVQRVKLFVANRQST